MALTFPNRAIRPKPDLIMELGENWAAALSNPMFLINLQLLVWGFSRLI